MILKVDANLTKLVLCLSRKSHAKSQPRSTEDSFKIKFILYYFYLKISRTCFVTKAIIEFAGVVQIYDLAFY